MKAFPEEKNTSEAAGDDAGAREAQINPLVDLLRAQTAPALSGLIGQLFDDLPAQLPLVDPRTGSGEMSFPHAQIIQHVAEHRAEAEDEFAEILASTYEAPVETADRLDLDRLSVQPTEELEERIAIGGIMERVETVHAGALDDLRTRITHMIRNLGIPIARQALSPGTIANAIGSSLVPLRLPLAARLLILKQFEKFHVARLEEVFDQAIQLLEDHKINPAIVEAESSSDTGKTHAELAMAGAPTLDRATLRALKRIATAEHEALKGETEFARELIEFATTKEPKTEHVATSQRLSLVGQMCNEIISDPHLPASMHPLFERLRFPLIKIALADGSFFSNRGHPVRRLVTEAAETAASSHIASKTVIRRLEERLSQIAEQANLSATFVRPQLSRLDPLNMMQIAAFLDQQREESESRRENVLNKVRRVVTQEMDVHSLGKKPPESMSQFLRAGWGPLMSARLLRDGMNSESWVVSIERLVELMAIMDERKVTDIQLTQRPFLRQQVASDLNEIGMRPDRIESALAYLDQAFEEVERRRKLLPPEERERGDSDLELLSPMETARVMGGSFDRPVDEPGKSTNRKPAEPEDMLAFDLSESLSEAQDQPPSPDNADAVSLLDEELSFEMPAMETPRPTEAETLELPDEKPSATSVQVDDDASDDDADTALDGPAEPPPDFKEAPVSVAAMRRSSSRDPASAGAPDDMAAESDMDLLSFCLTAETWFRVYNARNGQTLWLKVSNYYPEHGSVGFNGFDASKMLSMRTNALLDDLVAGRSEPVNPTPVQARAISELRRRRAQNA